MKTCTKCGESKPLTAFMKSRGRVWLTCRECNNAATRVWRAANSEKVAAQQRAYREANRDERIAKTRAWREANPEKIRAYAQTDRVKASNAAAQRRYRESDLEKSRERERGYREANIEAARARTRAWAAANRERDRMRHRFRRALKMAAPSEPYTLPEIAERSGWQCGLCHEAVTGQHAWPHPQSPSLDHIIPLSRGGSDLRSNIQLAHLRCNVSKGARLPDEMRRSIK